MKVHIVIDPETCVGIGKCEEIAEEAVELGDDGVSHVTGVAVDLEVAPLGIDFGAVSIGDAATREITLLNHGQVEIILDDATTSSARFAVASGPKCEPDATTTTRAGAADRRNGSRSWVSRK